jgi:hypothetical protein
MEIPSGSLAAADGYLYRAWWEAGDPRLGIQAQIKFARSDDDGVTWETQVLRENNFSTPPVMVAYGEQVTVLWLQCDGPRGGWGDTVSGVFCNRYTAESNNWGETFGVGMNPDVAPGVARVILQAYGGRHVMVYNRCRTGIPLRDCMAMRGAYAEEVVLGGRVIESGPGNHYPVRMLVSDPDVYVWIERPAGEGREIVLVHVQF